jgi:hypothetical protein
MLEFSFALDPFDINPVRPAPLSNMCKELLLSLTLYVNAHMSGNIINII